MDIEDLTRNIILFNIIIVPYFFMFILVFLLCFAVFVDFYVLGIYENSVVSYRSLQGRSKILPVNSYCVYKYYRMHQVHQTVYILALLVH